MNVDLGCGGGEGPGCARTGDPQPAAAVGRVVLLHSGHILITDIPLQPTYFTFSRRNWTPGK